MNKKIIRINDEVIYLNELQFNIHSEIVNQLTYDRYNIACSEIILELDDEKIDFFKNLLLSKNKLKKYNIFDIYGSDFILKSCLIKNIDYQENLKVYVSFDFYLKLNKSEIRHNKIENILKKKIN